MGFSVTHFFQELLTYLDETTIDEELRAELIEICIRDNCKYAIQCSMFAEEDLI